MKRVLEAETAIFHYVSVAHRQVHFRRMLTGLVDAMMAEIVLKSGVDWSQRATYGMNHVWETGVKLEMVAPADPAGRNGTGSEHERMLLRLTFDDGIAGGEEDGAE